jgi:SPP1 family predicted phage head-tail adaptor
MKKNQRTKESRVMNPAKFNKRIIFQQPPKSKNENGFPSIEWTNVKTVWAKIKTNQGKSKGLEFNVAGSVYNESDIRFICRYTSGITPQMRIIYNSRIFNILGVVNDDEKNVTLTIICKEVVK